ncbi:hypothetical protein GGX14DRAFT_604889 [Mycena pura]|uniref:Uncharacterized protein n=1 Tax=Mycena pura TaxID=153505 RepID=A0AAD6VLE1_9AGAR|nr:hypothetical protein GGX14DRAFT_604889 [Mycena pura]
MAATYYPQHDEHVAHSQLDVLPAHSSPAAQLPEEIIENIVECLRYPVHPQFEATERFLKEGASRFYLSAFSKVCKSIRCTVERLLYRDIHVDIIGWTRHIQSYDTQKHPMWPAGCLRLLLRTMKGRPELGLFVRSIAVRWSELSPETVLESFEFLRQCPGLHSLAFSSLPDALLSVLHSMNLPITSFGAVLPAASVSRVIGMFPRLRNLHLHIHGQPSSMSIPDHGITELTLKLVDFDVPLLQFAFAVPRPGHVRNLYLEVKDTQSARNAIAFPRPTTSMQASVEQLTLKNIDPFTPTKCNGDLHFSLTEMITLHHLHVMRPSLLPASAFECLPPHLRTITFSDYALDSKKSAADSKSCFVQSVVESLKWNAPSVRLAGIKTYGAFPDDPWELGDLTPLQVLCREEKLPFVQIGSFADIQPQLMIFRIAATTRSTTLIPDWTTRTDRLVHQVWVNEVLFLAESGLLSVPVVRPTGLETEHHWHLVRVDHREQV